MNSEDSRYSQAGTMEVADPDRPGQTVQAVRPRLSQAGRIARTHRMEAGQRLDHLAYAFYGDAGRGWRILDAEDEVFFAEELEEPARLVHLPGEPK